MIQIISKLVALLMTIVSSATEYCRLELPFPAIRHATPLPSRVKTKSTTDVLSGLVDWWRGSRQLLSGLANRNSLVSLALLLAIAVSGVAAVYAVHLNRQLFIELKTLQAEQDLAQRRWTQLLLEEGALSAPNRVEHIAASKLGMVAPAAAQTEMVR